MIHLLFGIVAAACTFVQFVWEKCNRGTAYRCAAIHPEYEYLSRQLACLTLRQSSKPSSVTVTLS
jgi:hypothetical protein